MSAFYNPTAVYPQGCVRLAWEDVKRTPGYVGTFFFLALLMMVPILNFVVAGYLLRWSREVPFGENTLLPQKKVTGKNFEFGFYAFVINIIIGIAVGVLSFVLELVPLVGALCALAVSLASALFLNMMQMRMIMGENLGDAFDLKDIWEKAKRGLGQLCFVSWVPSLVVGLIAGALGTVLALMLVFGMIGSALMSSSVDVMNAAVLASMFPLIMGLLVIVYVVMVISMVAYVLTYRAMGYWVVRYAPEWTDLGANPLPESSETIM